MTRFRILYLSPAKSEAFRSRAPKKAPYILRRSHYEAGSEIMAANPYELWGALRDAPEGDRPEAPKPLRIGDVLETSDGLLLCNFWGFDPAEWQAGDFPRGAKSSSSRRNSSPRKAASTRG